MGNLLLNSPCIWYISELSCSAVKIWEGKWKYGKILEKPWRKQSGCWMEEANWRTIELAPHCCELFIDRRGRHFITASFLAHWDESIPCFIIIWVTNQEDWTSMKPENEAIASIIHEHFISALYQGGLEQCPQTPVVNSASLHSWDKFIFSRVASAWENRTVAGDAKTYELMNNVHVNFFLALVKSVQNFTLYFRESD